MNESKKEHPSYGMISVSKFTMRDKTFFGSSIKHNGGISISIKNATIRRHLHTDWFSPEDTIIDVEMSYNQFAEMITAGMNTSGTPCTIQYTKDLGLIKPDVFTPKRKEFENEFKEDMVQLAKSLDKLVEDSKAILTNKSKPLNSAERELILNQITKLRQEISSNIPFVVSSFNEAIDKTVTEAKGEIEGFYEAKIRSLGIKSLQDAYSVPEIEESKQDVE